MYIPSPEDYEVYDENSSFPESGEITIHTEPPDVTESLEGKIFLMSPFNVCIAFLLYYWWEVDTNTPYPYDRQVFSAWEEGGEVPQERAPDGVLTPNHILAVNAPYAANGLENWRMIELAEGTAEQILLEMGWEGDPSPFDIYIRRYISNQANKYNRQELWRLCYCDMPEYRRSSFPVSLIPVGILAGLGTLMTGGTLVGIHSGIGRHRRRHL